VPEDRSRSEQEDAARWAAVFHAALRGVVTIDSNGRIQSINPACLNMFGYDEGELDGRNVRCLMPSPDADHHDDYLKRYLSSGKGKIIGIGRDVVAMKKDGTTFPIHLSVGEYRFEGNVGFVALLHDMTDQRRAEEQLAESDQIVRATTAEAKMHRERLERMDRISLAGEMASGIAHEVNQPLSAIANYTRALLHMLEVEQLGSEDLRSTVEKVRLQSQRAGEIVGRMRDFVSRHPSEPGPTSLNEVIQEVLSFAELSAHGRRVTVETDLCEDLPEVLFDRVQLQQVILNLVNNAVEACTLVGPEKIVIRSLSVDGSTIALHVIDNGAGIDPVTESRLFEPFFSSKRNGTGMGLAISHSIVESQGGTLGFTRNADRGVTFFVELPIL